jgi:hypothetical protein
MGVDAWAVAGEAVNNAVKRRPKNPEKSAVAIRNMVLTIWLPQVPTN